MTSRRLLTLRMRLRWFAIGSLLLAVALLIAIIGNRMTYGRVLWRKLFVDSYQSLASSLLGAVVTIVFVDSVNRRTLSREGLQDALDQLTVGPSEGRSVAVRLLRARGWLTNGMMRRSTLRDLDLRGVDLDDADLRFCELSGSNLDGSTLFRSALDRAHLVGASLRESNLSLASLRRANLYRADLTGARLDGTDLRGAVLTGAKVTDSQLARAIVDDRTVR